MRIQRMNRRAGRSPSRTLRSGFTLIELMVVVVIIAMLSLVLGKAASMVMGKSAMTGCAAKLRSIGTVVRAYATEWDGMTNPNGDAYPAQFGHQLRLNPDDGLANPDYVQADAFAATEFLCPLDQNPFVIQSGYRSSYQLASGFIGRNVMAVGSSRSTVLMSEMGKRHKNKGFESAIYLFADLHFEITGPDPDNPGEEGVMPGLHSRWYTSTSRNVPASEPKKELVWCDPIVRESRDGVHFLPMARYNSTSGWQTIPEWDGGTAANEPRRILGVWNGNLEFPQAGSYTILFQAESSDETFLDVDGTVAQGRGNRSVNVTISELVVPVEFRFVERGTGALSGFPRSYFRLYWQRTSAPLMTRRPIPAEAMFHLPFELSNVQN